MLRLQKVILRRRNEGCLELDRIHRSMPVRYATLISLQ